MKAPRRLLTLTATVVLAQPSFLLVLLGAARAAARRAPSPAGPGTTRFTVLVPAHDESTGLLPTVDSLAQQDYDRDEVTVVVVADNCSDDTADVARSAGATVWERHEPGSRGKGQALAWALHRLLGSPDAPDAVVVVDADCVASPSMLRVFDARLHAGARAVQCRYDASNPEASPKAALRYAAMVLFNTVRLEGKDALGASSGLSGTGMCFSTGLLHDVPWAAGSLSEDIEQHARLVAAGERVAFAPDATVSSPVPVTTSQARQQELRWEAGRLEVAREHGLPLLLAGVRERDRSKALTGVDLLTVPHAAWALGLATVAVAALATRSRSALALVLAAGAAESAYVLGGLRHAGAPRGVRAALLRAPALVLGRLPVLARVAAGRGPSEWVRTDRSAR